MTGIAGEQDPDGRIRRTIDEFVCGDVALADVGTKIRGWVSAGAVSAAAVDTVLREAARRGNLTADAYRRLTNMTRPAGIVDPGSRESFRANAPHVTAETLLRRAAPTTSPAAAETKYRAPNHESATRTAGSSATPGPPVAHGTEPILETDSNTATLSDPHAWTGVWGAEIGAGDVLSNRYRVERKLGEGGMGIVFLAADVEDKNRQFAVKVLKSDFRRDPTMIRLLEDEVDKGRRLTHPNVVAVYLLMRHQTVVYILMQYLEGKTLEQLLTDDFARGMPWNRAEPLIQGLGAGLAYAHDNGVIHSDIKPANVFITTAGLPKMLDFGIARAVRGIRTALGSGEVHALTESYASYEMLENQKPDIRDDIYSFACVIYEMLTGRHPFDGDSASHAHGLKLRPKPVPSLSKSQNRALERALAFQREDRTASVEELLTGLKPRAGKDKWRPAWIIPVTLAVPLVPLAGWLLRSQVLRPNADEQFVQSLLKPATTRSVDYDPVRAQEDLAMAADDLAKASKQFDAGLLSEGTSNAFDAYLQVLEVDPSNRSAAVGVLEILKLYRREVRRLADEGQTRQALDLARMAVKAQAERKLPADPELNALTEQLAAKLGIAGSPAT
jgi:serine/threonine protein kinase